MAEKTPEEIGENLAARLAKMTPELLEGHARASERAHTLRVEGIRRLEAVVNTGRKIPTHPETSPTVVFFGAVNTHLPDYARTVADAARNAASQLLPDLREPKDGLQNQGADRGVELIAGHAIAALYERLGVPAEQPQTESPTTAVA